MSGTSPSECAGVADNYTPAGPATSRSVVGSVVIVVVVRLAGAQDVDAAEGTGGVHDHLLARSGTGERALAAAEDHRSRGAGPHAVRHDDLDLAEEHADLDPVLA